MCEAWTFWLIVGCSVSARFFGRGGTYAGIHASGFRDFLLKPELLRAVVDCGFEHPSEVQHECIPQAHHLIFLYIFAEVMEIESPAGRRF